MQPFVSPVGPKVPMPNCSREIFELVFTTTLMKMMRDQSNKYARGVMGNEKYQSWQGISVEELRAYLGFSILMGIVSLPSLDDYWSRDPVLGEGPSSH